MDNTQSRNETLVFGLDIGTRSIVGVVGYMERNRFKVIAMAEQKHETRAMLDGQIHDIYKVGDTIRKVKNSLENQLERELSDVCIAAAGRVLKTVNSSAEYEFEEETRVTQEHIYSLNLLAVENAHNKINEKEDKARFYCVGNTPIRYQLNGYDINNLEGHKASKISVELIATFLPEEVVDGLYEAVEYAGLNVASLTLEPIAAMNIAIPEQYRLLNIGLVDVGAGTSDICLTKDGCIIAYGMIPCAGDEITECIAKTYLVDFNTVGGGGKIPGYTERVADCLGIPHQRVAVRGEEVLTAVDFQVDNFKKDSLYVTPVGICTNYYTQKNNFVFVTVNKERIKLYDTSNLTVVDAVMQIGFPNEKLFPRRGAEINFTVNGKSRLVRGSAGEGAVVTLNGRPANLHTPIEQNDIIVVTESTVGEPASITIGQLEEFNSQITFIVNDKTIVCPRFAYVNGELKSEFYDINDGDKIRMENFYTVAQLFEFLDLDYKTLNVTVNNEPADKNTKVYENFTVRTSSLEEYNENIMASEKLQESEETDDKVAEEPVIQPQDITITVNGQSVVLSGKPDYIVVDLFQFYPFDLTMVRGNLVFLHNGNDADYSSPLNDGDVIELRWEDK